MEPIGLIALARKQRGTPRVAMIRPAREGPTTAAVLKMVELSAIALSRSSRPTSSIMKDCRVGTSKELTDPTTAAATSTIQN